VINKESHFNRYIGFAKAVLAPYLGAWLLSAGQQHVFSESV